MAKTDNHRFLESQPRRTSKHHRTEEGLAIGQPGTVPATLRHHSEEDLFWEVHGTLRDSEGHTMFRECNCKNINSVDIFEV